MTRIPPVKRGEVIRAKWLTDVAREINQLNDSAAPPRDLSGGSFIEGETPQDAGGTFLERYRITETVRITSESDEDVYVDVERIRLISFSGLGGRRLTLVLDED